jgi:hypothetical protein
MRVSSRPAARRQSISEFQQLRVRELEQLQRRGDAGFGVIYEGGVPGGNDQIITRYDSR